MHTSTKTTSFLKFVIPSLIGIFLFMIPISQDGSITILVAILSKWLQNLLSPFIVTILFTIVTLSAILTLVTKLFKPKYIIKNDFLNNLFNPSWLWTIIRLLAFIFVSTILISTKLDISTLPSFLIPVVEMISSGDTGTLVMSDLLPILLSIFLFAGLFLPLLLNFGLLEFVGALLVKVMRPIFNLPGRSAIDCIASWLGDGTIGVMLTSKQYEDGFYTAREATVIGTTFSLVSITFSLVVIDTVGLSHMFVPFYFTVTIASIVAAVILPKLPPLSLKKDVLIDGSKPMQEESTEHINFKYGLKLAVNKAEEQSLFKCIVIDGIKNVLDMWFAVIPVVMGVGTIALILANYTSLFEILGLPLIPILSILGIPEAVEASTTLIAGFADMLLPTIMSTNIESDLTRFVIASTSVCQLIYLSEVGALLLSSKIPVRLGELFIIFLERTLITLPIIAFIAHLIF